MKRQTPKKSLERSRKSKASPKKAHLQRREASQIGDFSGECRNCQKKLLEDDRALYVEEEVGRVFCCEKCIAEFFTPEIKKLEKEYFKRISPSELSGEEKEGLAHLRWLTLQEPDEVWREKTISGDYRFTLISEFQPDLRKVWCVCICLCLRGEPSFLYLAFPTRSSELTEQYRKGERMQIHYRSANSQGDVEQSHSMDYAPSLAAKPSEEAGFVDGLADEWTEDETLRAQVPHSTSSGDIPVQEYSLYESCIEETLEVPDEVWSIELKKHSSLRLYHFLKSYPDETPGVWYIVIARETEDEDQIEILDAFPTRDLNLVEQFRKGLQEVGANQNQEQLKRMMH